MRMLWNHPAWCGALAMILAIGCFQTEDDDDPGGNLWKDDDGGDGGDGADGGPGGGGTGLDSGDGGDGGGDGGDGGTGSGSGGSSGTTDQDGDGYSEAEGDCDDKDDSSYPGNHKDTCDGADNNCDGWTDEDFNGDPYEPDPVDFGEITDSADASAYLNPEEDADDFYFYVEDGWWDSWGFVVEADAPSGVDVVIEIYKYDADTEEWSLLDFVDDAGAGKTETIEIEGDWNDDDSGWYAALLFSETDQSCQSKYTLTVSL